MRLDASKLMDLLWQGSLPPDAQSVQAAGFDLLVLCAREAQPPDAALQGLSVIRCPLVDNGSIDQQLWLQAAQCARDVTLYVRHGHRVLVTCVQGLNRSGLVCAIALHLLTGHPGHECVQYVRKRRRGALNNEAFVAALTNRLDSA